MHLLFFPLSSVSSHGKNKHIFFSAQTFITILSLFFKSNFPFAFGKLATVPSVKSFILSSYSAVRICQLCIQPYTINIAYSLPVRTKKISLYVLYIVIMLTSVRPVKYEFVCVGVYSGWWCVSSGSRHPVPDLEPGHVSNISSGSERLDQNDGTECLDPQPVQEDCQGDPNRES